MDDDDGPTARSVWERELELIHDEDRPDSEARLDELRQESIDLEQEIADTIAERSDLWADAGEVLAYHEYDRDELLHTYKQLVARRFATAVASHPAEDRDMWDLLDDYDDDPAAIKARFDELFGDDLEENDAA